MPRRLAHGVFGVKLTHGDNNIFTRIALFVLVGLTYQKTILIVKFALELENHGRSIVKAALESSHLRLRPILMTSFAFIMGVVPLVFSQGASSEMRHAMGETVVSGLLGKPAADFSASDNPLTSIAGLPIIPAGLPSSLLERRPDIAAAQRTMEASNARIGVARSAMFPALMLNASGGEGTSLANI